jgi:hypothetical protein
VRPAITLTPATQTPNAAAATSSTPPKLLLPLPPPLAPPAPAPAPDNNCDIVLEQMKESTEIYDSLKKQFKEMNTKDRRDFAMCMLPRYQAILEDPASLWTLPQQNALNHLKMIMDYLHRGDVMALVVSIEQLDTFLIHEGRNRSTKIVNEIKLQTIGVIMNLARLVSDSLLGLVWFCFVLFRFFLCVCVCLFWFALFRFCFCFCFVLFLLLLLLLLGCLFVCFVCLFVFCCCCWGRYTISVPPGK